MVVKVAGAWTHYPQRILPEHLSNDFKVAWLRFLTRCWRSGPKLPLEGNPAATDEFVTGGMHLLHDAVEATLGAVRNHGNIPQQQISSITVTEQLNMECSAFAQ